ncbi:aminoacyl-tRNA hydrolase [Mucilaginibacter sp. S1162]|uniref:Peptidyl-tRNA hydrolase n=2 Tax=Mucilaginibacter humi TaxID=2732510 RepID=A0ABX1W188_9SPHI|nr:aminoacyl-tRNA hydrolase [Mucilaginibacter humi]
MRPYFAKFLKKPKSAIARPVPVNNNMKYLIVGLGNIGPEYADTRHNIGFMILDELAKQEGAKFHNMRLAYYTEVSHKGRTLHLIKPTTYMNLSGKALNHWMNELKIPVENVLVLVDDIALPLGTLRLKPKGSAAGHNGLKHIEATLGNNEYARLRFGVGDNYPKGRQVDYVLSGFDADEQPELPVLIDRSIEMIKSFATIGTELTMTKFNK